MTAIRKELRRRRRPLGLATMLVALTTVLVFALGASSTIGLSTFEAVDGNLKVDTAGNLDWANVAELRQLDATGPTDDSFGQGTSEDYPVPDDRDRLDPAEQERPEVDVVLRSQRRCNASLRRAGVESRPGPEWDDEHGLRIQQVVRALGERSDPGPLSGRRSRPVRPGPRRQRPRAVPVSLGDQRPRIAVRCEQHDAVLGQHDGVRPASEGEPDGCGHRYRLDQHGCDPCW